MLLAIRTILVAVIAISVIAMLIGVVGMMLPGCAPPRTAVSAESCRMAVDREYLPPLVVEARHNCPRGGRAEDCVSVATLNSYQAAIEGCRESR